MKHILNKINILIKIITVTNIVFTLQLIELLNIFRVLTEKIKDFLTFITYPTERAFLKSIVKMTSIINSF